MSYEGVTFIFDIDGTLCPIKRKDENYADLVPHKEIVEKMSRCKAEGAKIVLFSSRNMKTYQGNIGLINKNTAPTMIEWLKKWDIPYDEIIFGKPWPGDVGFYVDDRAIRPSEFVNGELQDFERLCDDSRM